MDEVETFRVRIERILMPPAVVAGMNPYVIMSLAYMFRGSNEDAPPIHLTQENGYWRIHDGRHRFVASVLAGRQDVLAVDHDVYEAARARQERHLVAVL